MCGLVGIVGQRPVNQALYDALTVLQHRGQDAAGIMTDDAGRLRVRKSNGLVRDVFQERHMLKLGGNVGLGHVRFPLAFPRAVWDHFARAGCVRAPPSAQHLACGSWQGA